MGDVGIHCYDCGAVVRVDEAHPEQGLRVARWTLSHGQTFCSTCSQRRALPDPWGHGWAEPHGSERSDDRLEGSTEQVPIGPAIADEATRISLARYRRRALGLLLGAVLAVAILIGLLDAQAQSAKRLLTTGARTPGVVLASSTGREGGRMLVEYMADGTIHRGTVDYSNSEEYVPGDRVLVIYDPSEPSRIRTSIDSNQGGVFHHLLIYGLIAALVAALGCANASVRPRRWRRMLGESWRPYRSTYLPAKPRRAAPGLALVPLDEPGAPPKMLRLAAALPQRVARLGGKRVVWLVGDPASRAVIAIPATRELYAASAPRGFLGRSWLAEQKPPSRRSRLAARVYFGLFGAIAAFAAALAIGRHAWLVAALLAVKATGLLTVAVRRRGRPQSRADGEG